MAYCEDTDLLVGGIPMPAYLNAEKFVDDAADEIDSYLGRLYVTPISVEANTPQVRPTRLLLKRINSHLATGRLIQAADASGQNKQLHAYATSLIAGAILALQQLVEGSPLEGATPLPSTEDPDANAVTGPLIRNVDAESNVEAFYDRIAAPGFSYGLGESLIRRF